jgi:hypothetical protein
MNYGYQLLRYLGVAILVVMTGSVFAQSGESSRLFCHSVGNSTPEPLGDRDGHSISVAEVSCRVEGGLTDGGILTGTGITEWDKTNGVLLSGSGVTRKPGATTAYRNTEAKVALTLADGKVVGSTGSGRGLFTMATGTAASLSGKTYTFTFKSVGPGQTVFDVKVD